MAPEMDEIQNVLAGMPFQCSMEIRVSSHGLEDWSDGSQVSHCSASLVRVLGRIRFACLASYPGGAMWIPTWQWNSGVTLYPCKGTRGVIGVRPSSRHVICGLGEGL